jgi:hypothetical protein
MTRKTGIGALLLVACTLILTSCNQTDQKRNTKEKPTGTVATDPLPSWNQSTAKQAILDFVKNSTDSTNKGYIAVADRIACFDNDGTLWSEKPLPFQLFFVMDRIKAMAPQHPEWKNKQPYKGILEGDPKSALAGGEKALMELIMTSHTGMTADEFDKTVKDWMATATHPKTGKHYNEMVYQPMLELLNFLRANGYKTFIVSGGGIDFMRVWAEKAYGIPPYQVVGSSAKVNYDTTLSPPAIVKLPVIDFNDDKLGKPVGIYQHIGKRPVFTAGNSDGDWGMMQYTSTGTGPHFGLYIHHTDSLREYFYDRKDGLARLNKGLNDAEKYKWVVVDMKTDWSRIYPYDK